MSDEALLAEYDSGDALLAAARALREQGYVELDAYTPYPLHGAEEALGLRKSKLPIYVAIAAALGAGGAYLLQWFIAAYDYPLIVGNRPAHMPLAFVPITFEMGVLFSAVTATVLVLVFAGLPRLWHPVFEVPGFERATIDRFFLAVSVRDRRFDRAKTTADLEATSPLRVVFAGRRA